MAVSRVVPTRSASCSWVSRTDTGGDPARVASVEQIRAGTGRSTVSDSRRSSSPIRAPRASVIRVTIRRSVSSSRSTSWRVMTHTTPESSTSAKVCCIRWASVGIAPKSSPGSTIEVVRLRPSAAVR